MSLADNPVRATSATAPPGGSSGWATLQPSWRNFSSVSLKFVGLGSWTSFVRATHSLPEPREPRRARTWLLGRQSSVGCSVCTYFVFSGLCEHERREASGIWRDPPAKGLPDGGGPGLIVILLVLIHPHLCSTLCVPTSREGKNQVTRAGKEWR